MISRIPSFPNLVRKEAAAALLAVGVVCLLAAGFDAPLDGPADRGGVPADHVRAPWIFVGIQQMLRFLPSMVAGIAIPLVALMILGFMPFMIRWKRLSAGAFFSVLVASIALTVWGYWG